MSKQEKKVFVFEDTESMRVDKYLSVMLDSLSRSLISQWIKKGCVEINGSVTTQPKTHLKLQDNITVSFPENFREEIPIEAQQGSIDIAYDCDHFMIINKPVGLVVHPGAGINDRTLVNYLAYSHPDITSLPNWGLVHRLDKDTTGLLIVAKTQEGYQGLNKMMLNREITRLYQALIQGHLRYSRTVDTKISRCHHNRLKRAVSLSEYAKQAITHIKIINHYEQFTHIQCQLETGRTHQIRVHCEHIGHPIIGDSLYKGRLNNNTSLIDRQALHAYRLSLKCPITLKDIDIEIPLPKDIDTLLNNAPIK